MNVKMMLYSKPIGLLCLLCSVSAQAQYHKYRALLPVVGGSGFYKLAVTPEVSAYAATDLHDLRIRDEQGREVRYLRGTELPQRWGGFMPFAIESRQTAGDGNTNVRLRNTSAQPIEAVQLKVRNTEAQRMASVSGSKDGRTWYSLRDSFALAITTARVDTAVCTIPLPPTSYPWLQLTVFDKGRLPLEVLAAGIVSSNALRSHYIEVPAPVWKQKDSNDHNTYLWLHFPHPYLVQKLSLQFDAPTFYRREAELYANGLQVTRFTASYNMPASVWTQLHDTDAVLVIRNEDSPPLRLKSVTGWQQQQYLLAYLQSGRQYVLTFGDSTLSSPLYDFRYFKDSMAIDAMPEIVPEKPAAIRQPGNPQSKPLIGKTGMWAIILTVLAALIIGTVAMMKQIKSDS